MKEQIKELRVKIDGLAQLTKELKPIGINTGELDFRKENSKEIEKAVDSLFLGKAWLGKLLGELGTENPYGSGYKTKEDIVPTQDITFKLPITNDDNGVWWTLGNPLLNHIEKVDWLRTEIQKVQKCFVNEIFVELDKLNLMFYCNCIQQHLCEARFWLGFEMERIKNEQ